MSDLVGNRFVGYNTIDNDSHLTSGSHDPTRLTIEVMQ